MEPNQLDIKKYEKAKKRVKEIKGFYSHLTSYILVIFFLMYINLRFSPEHIWFYWPMLGWGIGLFFHAFSVFGDDLFFSQEWQQKKIQKYIDKERENFKK